MKSWNEGQVSWNQAASGSSWSLAGAQQAGVDHGSTVLGTVTVSATGLVTITLNAAGIAVVQNWINNPASNNGFIIQDYANTTSDGFTFSSSEHGTVSYRPKLTIGYPASTGAPTVSESPGTVVLSNFSERPAGDSASWACPFRLERLGTQESAGTSGRELPQQMPADLLGDATLAAESHDSSSRWLSESMDVPAPNAGAADKTLETQWQDSTSLDPDTLDTVYCDVNLGGALLNI